jgi:hypothetical protein
MTRSGRDIPVDGSNIVAELILSYLREIHPSPLENGLVLAREDLVDQASGRDFYLSDLFEYFFGNHRV